MEALDKREVKVYFFDVLFRNPLAHLGNVPNGDMPHFVSYILCIGFEHHTHLLTEALLSKTHAIHLTIKLVSSEPEEI